MKRRIGEQKENLIRKNKRERCVLCGCATEMQRDWPVSMRKYYIEGAGQLCRSCYVDVYEQ